MVNTRGEAALVRPRLGDVVFSRFVTRDTAWCGPRDVMNDTRWCEHQPSPTTWQGWEDLLQCLHVALHLLSVLRPGLLLANCDPSPALTSPLYQAATFDLCRCGDEMTAREHYLGWPHLTVTSEQTRELPPPSSYTTMVTLVTLNFIPDLFKEFDFEQEKELHSMESIIIPFMW